MAADTDAPVCTRICLHCASIDESHPYHEEAARINDK